MEVESETNVVHVAALKALLAGIMIDLSQKAQIAALKQNEASTKVLFKYLDYSNIFFFALAMEFLENNGINEHNIKL